ncbi:MAG: Cof-type HAD-IIB family hydrolase [Coprobacillus sp.]
MSIKMIAVDMDGTFLNNHSTYDKERFQKIYNVLKERRIHFVVASGNPYKQLQATFEDIKDELIYISDNGGYIVEGNQELFSSYLNAQDIQVIIQSLKDMPDVLCWACTKEQSYTLSSISDHFYEMFLPYFPGVKKIEDFSLIQNPILKFALYLPKGNVKERIADFSEIVSEHVRVVDSGHYCVDLIPTQTNKGVAIEFLMDRYRLKPEEIMAFGDAGNDEEMLNVAGYGYVMENAKDDFKAKFHYHAPSNDDQGVLQVIENYIMCNVFI